MEYLSLWKWKGPYLTNIYFHWISPTIKYILKHHCLNLVHPQKLSLEYFTSCQSSAMGNCLFGKHFFCIQIINNNFFAKKINFPLQNIFSTYSFYQRYLERGNYKGFLPTALQFLKQDYNVPDSNILPW